MCHSNPSALPRRSARCRSSKSSCLLHASSRSPHMLRSLLRHSTCIETHSHHTLRGLPLYPPRTAARLHHSLRGTLQLHSLRGTLQLQRSLTIPPYLPIALPKRAFRCRASRSSFILYRQFNSLLSRARAASPLRTLKPRGRYAICPCIRPSHDTTFPYTTAPTTLPSYDIATRLSRYRNSVNIRAIRCYPSRKPQFCSKT